MSTHADPGNETSGTTASQYRAQNLLKTIVWKAMQFDDLPLWYERDQAVWAIEDTIERVAPEAAE